jgi:hypothetical protein
LARSTPAWIVFTSAGTRIVRPDAWNCGAGSLPSPTGSIGVASEASPTESWPRWPLVGVPCSVQ